MAVATPANCATSLHGAARDALEVSYPMCDGSVPAGDAPSRAVDGHPGGAQRQRALGYFDGGHGAHGDVLTPKRLAELGNFQVERPVVVG
jgi:hypothetical protein